MNNNCCEALNILLHEPMAPIKDALRRSDYINQGKRAFEITKKLPGVTGFNKRDFVAVDAAHKDHLEVFNKHGDWICVADFDGTYNHAKTEQAKNGEPRRPLREG